jgi:hypothetical protein
MMFLDCPAYLYQDGAMRCGLPAEVRCRFTMRSSDGLIESAMIRCPAGHHFTGAIESLTWDGKDNYDSGAAGAGSRAGSDGLQRGHDGRDGGGGGPGLRGARAELKRKVGVPNTAPAYYLGRPAALWITALRSRRRPAASYPMKPPSAAATQPRTPGYSGTVDFPRQAWGHGHGEAAPWVSA